VKEVTAPPMKIRRDAPGDHRGTAPRPGGVDRPPRPAYRAKERPFDQFASSLIVAAVSGNPLAGSSSMRIAHGTDAMRAASWESRSERPACRLRGAARLRARFVGGAVVALWLVGAAPAQIGAGAEGKTAAGATGKSTPENAAAKKKVARPKRLNPVGRPDGSIIDQPARWYLWFDEREDRWCLRSTTSGKLVQFSGTITVSDGKVDSVVGVGFANLKGRKEKNNSWSLSADRRTVTVNWKTASSSDGINFKVSGERATLKFDLKIAGADKPESIFVGAAKGHPGANPFELPSAPDETPTEPDTKPRKSAKKAVTKKDD